MAGAIQPLSPPTAATETGADIVVVGAGPVGVRCIRELLQRGCSRRIVLIGDEPWAPYNRVQLSSLLAGDIGLADIDLAAADDGLWQQARDSGQLVEQFGCRVLEIDTDKQRIRDHLGRWHAYGQLILALGSRAHIPGVPGVGLSGVFTFRDLRDTGALLARTARSRHVVVVGGGLLGLEAARALQRGNTRVTVVQQSPHLMNRQLDTEAARRLQARVEALGIEVVTGSGLGAVLDARQLHGAAQVHGMPTSAAAAVRLRDERVIACDTVLLATGIKPNIDLARQAWIRVNTGIVVDDRLRTSLPGVYAVGECAEHSGRTYGLVAPGYEQAAVLAENLLGGDARYNGSINATQLKVAGEAVFSAGDAVEPSPSARQKILTWQSSDGRYRKLVLVRGCLIGALSIGANPEATRLQEAVRSRRRLTALQQWRFRRDGNCWSEEAALQVAAWPAQTLVCQCMGVSRGRLSASIAAGCGTAEALGAACGAGTVCGSCKPLLQALLGDNAPRDVERGIAAVWIGSAVATLLCLLWAFAPALTVAGSVQLNRLPESVWNDGLAKQITGFSVLGLTAIGLLLSLRKRWARLRWGAFFGWRMLHIGVGVGALLTLLAHTGLATGSNLNRWLLVDFLALILLGAIAGAGLGFEHRLQPAQARQMRSLLLWGHILAVWPLPALLGFHILTVYYF